MFSLDSLYKDIDYELWKTTDATNKTYTQEIILIISGLKHLITLR